MDKLISFVIPAKNEAASIGSIVAGIRQVFANAEVIVVDDGSADSTRRLSEQAGAKVVVHPYSKGNGAAIKSGALAATGEVIVFMDADGQHDPHEVLRILEELSKGYDMVVGARHVSAQASRGRAMANGIYNWLASRMVGQPVLDLTSGFRAVKRHLFLRYLYLLPNGFSYPTTITMAFFRAGFSVGYVPVAVKKRVGKSHIKPWKDGVRFLLIIFKIGSLYSPLKIFFPVSVMCFLMGCSHYLYVYLTRSQFSNMSVLLFLSALVIFLMGLVSEQVTALSYKDS